MSRRKVPVLSEYAKYFPSGDIAAAETGFSVGFEVKRWGAACPCDELARGHRCHANHPTTIPTSNSTASAAPTICHFPAEETRPVSVLAGNWVEILPVSVSRFRRLRSALSSAAD